MDVRKAAPVMIGVIFHVMTLDAINSLLFFEKTQIKNPVMTVIAIIGFSGAIL